MKLTKEEQYRLGIQDWEIANMKQNGAAGICVYETSQVVLDQWVPAYFATHGLKGDMTDRQKNDMSLAVAEGRARKPLCLSF